MQLANFGGFGQFNHNNDIFAVNITITLRTYLFLALGNATKIESNDEKFRLIGQSDDVQIRE